jgi:hypothetical protein
MQKLLIAMPLIEFLKFKGAVNQPLSNRVRSSGIKPIMKQPRP